jgi:hypothetical protein
MIGRLRVALTPRIKGPAAEKYLVDNLTTFSFYDRPGPQTLHRFSTGTYDGMYQVSEPQQDPSAFHQNI